MSVCVDERLTCFCLDTSSGADSDDPASDAAHRLAHVRHRRLLYRLVWQAGRHRREGCRSRQNLELRRWHRERAEVLPVASRRVRDWNMGSRGTWSHLASINPQHYVIPVSLTFRFRSMEGKSGRVNSIRIAPGLERRRGVVTGMSRLISPELPRAPSEHMRSKVS